MSDTALSPPIPMDGLAHALFEEAGDALFLLDPHDGSIMDANPVAQRLSGMTREELRGQSTTYLFRHEGQGGMGRLRGALKETQLVHGLDGFLLRPHRGGVWVPVSRSITRLHVEPRPLGLITARDRREQQEMFARVQDLEAEWRRVLGAVSDFLWSAGVSPQGEW